MTTTLSSNAVIPGPRAMPLVGTKGNLLRAFSDPVTFLEMAHARYGSVVGLTQGNPGMVFAFGPECNRQILSQPDVFISPSFVFFPTPEGHAARLLDAGLISMNGAQHKQHRRLMQPAFHRKQVDGYRDSMVAIVQRVLDIWPVGEERDINSAMQYLTMLISSKILFGIDQPQDAAEVGAMVRRWLYILTDPLVNVLPINVPGTPYRRALRHAERMVATLRARIAQKRADPTEQHDVLAVLMRSHDADGTLISDTELIGQANNLFSAGHETTGNALTWTLLLLEQHPRVLADLHDELTSVLGGDAPTAEQLGRLPLLDRVVKESLRLLPPITYAPRATAAPCELGGYALPQGSMVIYSQYVTHRLPELYPAPTRFLPERWEGDAPGTYAYIPFGAGPHMCIGASFATMEIKITLAMLLQRFRLALRPGARIDRNAKGFLAPRGGLPMRVLPQDRQFARAEQAGHTLFATTDARGA